MSQSFLQGDTAVAPQSGETSVAFTPTQDVQILTERKLQRKVQIKRRIISSTNRPQTFYPGTVELHETVHQLLMLHCQIVSWLGMHFNKHGWKLFYELETSATEINTQTVSSCAHRAA